MQTWNESVEILRTKKSIKGIKIQVDMTFWDCDEWNGKTTCDGIIDRWQNNTNKETLMVLWDGNQRNQAAVLVGLETHNAKLLPDANGKLPGSSSTPLHSSFGRFQHPRATLWPSHLPERAVGAHLIVSERNKAFWACLRTN